jgi:hypothetical protein
MTKLPRYQELLGSKAALSLSEKAGRVAIFIDANNFSFSPACSQHLPEQHEHRTKCCDTGQGNLGRINHRLDRNSFWSDNDRGNRSPA